jgi:hypothetical protein
MAYAELYILSFACDTRGKHGVTPHRRVVFIFTSLKTLNLAMVYNNICINSHHYYSIENVKKKKICWICNKQA